MTLDESSIQLPRPLAFCTTCREPNRDPTAVGRAIRCTRFAESGHRRCGGMFRSAVAAEDWTACPSCQATGRESDNNCSQCNGYGWLLARDPTS
jgi:DnaJ-class molecular chaperone